MPSGPLERPGKGGCSSSTCHRVFTSWRQVRVHGTAFASHAGEFNQFTGFSSAAADQVIRRTAKAIKMTLRGTDVGARWGGDEFVIVAPNTARAAAYTLAERLLLQAPKEPNAGEAGTTTSVGVATFDPSHHQSEDAESLMQAADDALHRAKAAGRNQVRVA